ncbi:MAG: 23S rRNA (adenine(2503)-C(2))-methyltransferase RlmN [Phycisphaerales bacterium]|nr:23S rRNA (adenine(2503)-C(2))-methyltransferase RlmN [Phycisphaerales bacterium]
MTPQSLREWWTSRGLSGGGFRADQVLDWVYAKGVADPAQMSNLSKRDREVLAAEMTFLSADVVRHQLATDGTQKLLLEWRDPGAPPATGLGLPILSGGAAGDPSRQTECVMIPSEERRTVCVSSQVGCPVGCRFCASGMGGLDGSLSAGRIVEQVWRMARLEGVGRVSNVVFMGMGEPLANFAAVMHAVRTLAAPWGMGISARKITISTVGLPQAIERLANEMDLPVTLALSLHAPNDEVRRRLIPWAEFTTVDELLGACAAWFKKTGREITLEYTLLRGVNDRPEQARELVDVVRRMHEEAGGRANVNLIRYNEVEGVPFERPRSEDVAKFQEILRAGGVNAHIRASRGRDIAAACGQLRHETSAGRNGDGTGPNDGRASLRRAEGAGR